MIIPSRRWALAVAALAGIAGASVAWHYHRVGLTLTHYDARGHLIVARRIFDSITPGWQQIGAVWLPLPHLLNAVPAQVDFFYRTGASAVALSVLAFAVATAAIAWIVGAVTESPLAGIAGAAAFAMNPNVLYLQATPMTEPLLIALTLLSVALLIAWCQEVSAGRLERATGWAFALACLTRYEAWPVTLSALAIAVWVRWRNGETPGHAAARVAAVAAYPIAAMIAFVIFSRIVVGAWFVDDFFVPENPAQGRPYESIAEIVWGVRALSGLGLVFVGSLGLAAMAVLGVARRARAAILLPLALLATSAVPWAAFIDGHPYRIRYMVPLLAAQAVGAGVLAGLWRRTAVLAPVLLLALLAVELRPLDASAPMVLEAQWDRPNIVARDQVTRCLKDRYEGETIMASMGSLGHYMQDLSRAGFQVRDFLHEGNGDIWLNALNDPQPFVGWILIEEKAEGGDMLAKRARENPEFLRGFSRVCEAAGVALYRRASAPAVVMRDVRTAR